MTLEQRNDNADEVRDQDSDQDGVHDSAQDSAQDSVKNFIHHPVLLKEVVQWLSVPGDGVFFDLTVGAGGHLEALAKRSAPGAELYGMDRDKLAIEAATKRLSIYPQVKQIMNAPFSTFSQSLRELGIKTIDGALFDLGVSSPQIDRAERGFSFQGDAPLDMRMDQEQTASASELINALSVSELADVFWKYGEEKRSGKIARAIVQSREMHPVRTTVDLRGIIAATVGQGNLTRTLARVFQALRIAVNDELSELEGTLPQVIDSLSIGARVGVISYHSLEDRIVKRTFARYAGACVCPPGMPLCVCGAQKELKPLTKKPIVASEQEIKSNSRSRSAKFRVAERVALPFGAGSAKQMGVGNE